MKKEARGEGLSNITSCEYIFIIKDKSSSIENAVGTFAKIISSINAFCYVKITR
jgi:hypothetical protein